MPIRPGHVESRARNAHGLTGVSQTSGSCDASMFAAITEECNVDDLLGGGLQSILHILGDAIPEAVELFIENEVSQNPFMFT